MTVKCLHCQSDVGQYDGMCSYCGWVWPGRPALAHPPPLTKVSFGAEMAQGGEYWGDEED